MRQTYRLSHSAAINWQALSPHQHFLYRRVADQDRAVLGVGMLESFEEPVFNSDGTATDWLFGHFHYDLKDRLEDLKARHAHESGEQLSLWWKPRWVLEWITGEVLLHCSEQDRASGEELAEALHSPVGVGPVNEQAKWEACTTQSKIGRAHV